MKKRKKKTTRKIRRISKRGSKKIRGPEGKTCFGTKEFSPISGICKNCLVRNECEKVKFKKIRKKTLLC